MKRATNSVAGCGEDLVRRAALLDAAVVHHDDQVGERHGFVLAVRDVNEGDAEILLQALQLGAHLDAQERVERGERLVEQQDLRVGDQRAGERHALLLAARKLRRKTLGAVASCRRA